MVKNKLTVLFILVFFLSGVYIFFFSESGLLERKKYELGRESLEHRIENLSIENDRLRALLSRYKKGELTDDDLLNSGYLPENSRVLILEGIEKDKKNKDIPSQGAATYSDTHHLKILWIVFSLFSVIVYLTRNLRIPGKNE